MKIFLVAIATLISIPSFASISVTPGYISFGRVKLNGQVQRMVTVRNNGQEAVRISTSGYCSHFSTMNHCHTLNKYASCSINVRFRPTMLGNHSCNLTIRASNGSVSYINMNGNAVR